MSSIYLRQQKQSRDIERCIYSHAVAVDIKVLNCQVPPFASAAFVLPLVVTNVHDLYLGLFTVWYIR